MRTLVVGDVHGCAHELVRLLDLVSADRCVLVGDLYTKGPDPAGVWRVIRDFGLDAVLGNHDARLLEALDGKRPRDRHAHATIATLDAEDPAWREHLRGLPLFLEGVAGFTVVHAALHPSGSLAKTKRSTALSLRRWPRDERAGRPWWRVYEGASPVVFGHDARGGLVWRERDGTPYLVGLDTGCVYGGALSGVVLEEGWLVQVPAARVYQAVTST